jgi:hypothetical protein
MVTALIILNIMLIIIILTILAFYIFRNKKDVIENKKDVKDVKDVIENICDNEDEYCEIDSSDYKQNKNIKQERVFDGRFVTDEEYQQMIKSKRSDISILMEELYDEYEYLKELSK